ncbi:hypothetical protein EB796_022032 [Bugula neritina]|uniref:Uncharacterized protein n=1 Tax=Bugula neritina TaxID=10212 RepID=A0A7J7J0G1_BUGNE|nr:hypothetical protein EB796_022032 [Bugula neritina]
MEVGACIVTFISLAVCLLYCCIRPGSFQTFNLALWVCETGQCRGIIHAFVIVCQLLFQSSCPIHQRSTIIPPLSAFSLVLCFSFSESPLRFVWLAFFSCLPVL